MAPPDDNNADDPKVKDLIDAATQADLERWFGLPSFQQLAEEKREPAPDDPDVVASRERREKALAAVDRTMVDAHFSRYELEPEQLIQFRSTIELMVDPSVAFLDLEMVDRKHKVAEPREVEIPWQLQDDLKDCTPQAILRDLHRPELDFQKYFDVVDIAAEQRVDGVAVVAETMATRWAIRSFGQLAAAEGRAILAESRQARRMPAATIVPLLPNRQVQE